MRDLFTGGVHATIALCNGCAGQWMRDSDLQRLSEVFEPVLVEWRELGATQEQQHQLLHCPECEGSPVMEKLKSERDRHVVLDRCAACGGVWLDANELRAIQQESLFAILSGLVRKSPAPK